MCLLKRIVLLCRQEYIWFRYIDGLLEKEKHDEDMWQCRIRIMTFIHFLVRLHFFPFSSMNSSLLSFFSMVKSFGVDGWIVLSNVILDVSESWWVWRWWLWKLGGFGGVVSLLFGGSQTYVILGVASFLMVTIGMILINTCILWCFSLWMMLLVVVLGLLWWLRLDIYK